jgi:hypothetical protein
MAKLDSSEPWGRFAKPYAQSLCAPRRAEAPSVPPLHRAASRAHSGSPSRTPAARTEDRPPRLAARATTEGCERVGRSPCCQRHRLVYRSRLSESQDRNEEIDERTATSIAGHGKEAANQHPSERQYEDEPEQHALLPSHRLGDRVRSCAGREGSYATYCSLHESTGRALANMPAVPESTLVFDGARGCMEVRDQLRRAVDCGTRSDVARSQSPLASS